MITTMRQDLTAALKARDRAAVAALRSALAAVENAGAVDGPSSAVPVVGLGATEVARKHLDADRIRAIVAAEVHERLDAAERYEQLQRPDEVDRLRAEADVLRRYLPS